MPGYQERQKKQGEGVELQDGDGRMKVKVKIFDGMGGSGGKAFWVKDQKKIKWWKTLIQKNAIKGRIIKEEE